MVYWGKPTYIVLLLGEMYVCRFVPYVIGMHYRKHMHELDALTGQTCAYKLVTTTHSAEMPEQRDRGQATTEEYSTMHG